MNYKIENIKEICENFKNALGNLNPPMSLVEFISKTGNIKVGFPTLYELNLLEKRITGYGVINDPWMTTDQKITASIFASHQGMNEDVLAVLGKILDRSAYSNDVNGIMRYIDELKGFESFFKQFVMVQGVRREFEQQELVCLYTAYALTECIAKGERVSYDKMSSILKEGENLYKEYLEKVVPDYRRNLFFRDNYVKVRNRLRSNAQDRGDINLFTSNFKEIEEDIHSIEDLDNIIYLENDDYEDNFEIFKNSIEKAIELGFADGLSEVVLWPSEDFIPDPKIQEQYRELCNKLIAYDQKKASKEEIKEQESIESQQIKPEEPKQPEDDAPVKQEEAKPEPEEKKTEEIIDDAEHPKETEELKESEEVKEHFEEPQMSVPINQISKGSEPEQEPASVPIDRANKNLEESNPDYNAPQQNSVLINRIPKYNPDEIQPEENDAEEIVENNKQPEEPKQEDAQKPVKESPDELAAKVKFMLKLSIKSLESAKTMVNSNEYKELIQTMKDIDSNGIKDLQMDLVKIAKKLDAYTTHKAKDGVKANTYKKLAAVQDANSWISKTLKTFEVECPSNYAEAYQSYNKADKNTLPSPDKLNYEAIAAKLSKLDPDINKAMAENADDCIRMIILKADAGKRPDLIAMRNKFNLVEAPKLDKQGFVK